MAFRSNGGHIAGEDISAYIDEELSPSEISRVDSHLRSCAECRALADDMRATQTLVRDLPLVRAPREFTLGREFDVASDIPAYASPRRGWFSFMPAVAMSAAILVLLVFADLTSLTTGGSGDSTNGTTSSAGRTVQDTAKAGAQENANAPQPQPLAPRPNIAGGNGQGFAPTPLPQAASAPPASGAQTPLSAPAAQPPTTGAGQAPTPTSYAVVIGPDDTKEDQQEQGAAQSRKDEDGVSTLRVFEGIAALALVGSLGGLYWQKRRG